MSLLFNMMMPLMLAGIALYGMARRVDVYDAVIHGAGDGLRVLYRIAPPLIALLTAVSMLRASGFLELCAQWLSPVLGALGIPPETAPLLLVRPVSGSAALGVGADIIATYGPDSLIGRTAAGCATPFDILPATGFASALSILAGVTAARVLARVWRDRR